MTTHDYVASLREVSAFPLLWWRLGATLFVTDRGEKITYGNHPRQYMLWHTAGPHIPQQDLVIVYLHGGGWRYGFPAWRSAAAARFTALGYPVLMPTYRLTPHYRFPELRADIIAAMRHALGLGYFSNKKILLVGESAGANLAALLLYDPIAMQEAGLAHQQVAGFLSLGGVLDLEAMPDSFVLRDYCGPRDGSMFDAASPLRLPGIKHSPPVCVLHGDRDGLVPLASATRFVAQLNTHQNGIARMHCLAGGNHIEVTTAWYLKEKHILWQEIIEWIQELMTSEKS